MLFSQRWVFVVVLEHDATIWILHTRNWETEKSRGGTAHLTSRGAWVGTVFSKPRHQTISRLRETLWVPEMLWDLNTRPLQCRLRVYRRRHRDWVSAVSLFVSGSGIYTFSPGTELWDAKCLGFHLLVFLTLRPQLVITRCSWVTRKAGHFSI